MAEKFICHWCHYIHNLNTKKDQITKTSEKKKTKKQGTKIRRPPPKLRIQEQNYQQQFMLIFENWLDKPEPPPKWLLLGFTMGGDGAHLL